jgi:hypothetical protein
MANTYATERKSFRAAASFLREEQPMTVFRVAAVQAARVLLDRDATLDRVADLARGAGDGAEPVVFPEAFVPAPPVWIDTARIWDGDREWCVLLADQSGRSAEPRDREAR